MKKFITVYNSKESPIDSQKEKWFIGLFENGYDTPYVKEFLPCMLSEDEKENLISYVDEDKLF